MIIEEFEVFKIVWVNLANLETWHSENIEKKTASKLEINGVMDSPNSVYGFFKKTSKERKLQELRQVDHLIDADVGVGNELLSLVYRVIQTHEIPLLKITKKERFDKLINEFSQSRIRFIEKELLLWQTINKPSEEIEETEIDNKKIEERDLRFTGLQKLK